MLNESEVRAMYEKALERAMGYCGGDDTLYQTHVYYACEIGRILEIDGNDTLAKLRESIVAR